MMMMTMIAVNGDVNSLLLSCFFFLRYIHVLSLSLHCTIAGQFALSDPAEICLMQQCASLHLVQ